MLDVEDDDADVPREEMCLACVERYVVKPEMCKLRFIAWKLSCPVPWSRSLPTFCFVYVFSRLYFRCRIYQLPYLPPAPFICSKDNFYSFPQSGQMYILW